MAAKDANGRFRITLTEAELAGLDCWRAARRMPRRAAAVRELLKRGLAADGFAEPRAEPRVQPPAPRDD